MAAALAELGAVDRAVYEALARTPTGNLDGPVRRLSEAADRSRLWLAIAAAVALFGGERGRRAALEGVLAIGVTSATVNLVAKPIAERIYDRVRPLPGNLVKPLEKFIPSAKRPETTGPDDLQLMS